MSPPVNPEFGRRVRELREAKKKTNPAFSLRQFAQAAGVSATFQSKIENGESPPPGADKIKRMAVLLETDADELLALAGKVDPDLPAIIREMPRAMADFLRTASEAGLTDEDIKRLTDKIREGK